MQKLFEIEDETPAAVAAQSSADTDQVTLPSGISVHLPVSLCGSNQSDSVRTFGWESPTWDDSVRGPCLGSSYSEDSSNTKQSRHSYGLQNVSDSPPRRSLLHEDFESDEFIVTSEEICF